MDPGHLATPSGTSPTSSQPRDILGEPNTGEGVSLLSVWRDPTDEQAERTLFWEHIGNAAVRRGRWKLVREWGDARELYDIGVLQGYQNRGIPKERAVG